MQYYLTDNYNEKDVRGISFPGGNHDFISNHPHKEIPEEKPKETAEETVKVF